MKSIQIFVPIVWVFITIQTAFCDIPFSVNPSNYKHWGAITAVVHSFTNENISGTGDVLAAFVGDECRGFARDLPWPPIHQKAPDFFYRLGATI